MRIHSFQELVTRIVHLSTRDGKQIPVTFSGTDAYTNTKTVNIPTLPSGTILTPNQFSIWLGYTIHEGPGHQTHSDLNLYETACLKRNNPQFSYILNLLEDIRIENADIKLYPGDRKYLDSVHHFVDSKIPSNLSQNPDIMGLIYKHLFVHHRDLDTNHISGTLDPKTTELISEIDLCFSTQDCINLADKVVNYLNEKKQEEQNQNQNQNQSGQQNEDKENQQGKENGQENQENSEKENGSESDGDNNQSPSENNEDNSSQNSSLGQEGQENSNTPPSFNFSNQSTAFWQEITEIKNIIQSLKQQIENEKEISSKPDPDQNLVGKSIFPPENISYDRIYVPSQENLDRYTQTRSQCSSQILALKKMFRIYLQAQTKKSQIRGLEEGKLDTQRLNIAATGANTIFKDQSLKLLPETAIELMIDMSGSMDAQIARTAAIILAEALNSIPQIKLSISGFTTNSRNYSPSYYNPINPNSGRQNGMDILQFKDFNTPYSKCRGRLGTITNTRNTPLGDAYGKSLEHIILRPEPRKIIFLITDGKPEFLHGRNHSDFLLMKKIHLTAKRFHIQTLGLGIGKCEFLSKYFDQSINITNIETLPQNLLQALKQFI